MKLGFYPGKVYSFVTFSKRDKMLLAKNEISPKLLFLVDAFGALLSAFLLGIILVKYERIFGIPASTLYFLATLPLFFMAYDIYAYREAESKQRKLLKGISIINTSYCLLSLGFAISHFKSITGYGWVYILIEILIVGYLAIIQYSVAQKPISNRTDGH